MPLRRPDGYVPTSHDLLPGQRARARALLWCLQLGAALSPTLRWGPAALLLAGAGCGGRSHAVGSGHDSDAQVTDAGAGDAGRVRDAGADGGAIHDAGADAPARPDASDWPRLCDTGSDCLEWWPRRGGGSAFCDQGVCCAGRLDVGGCVCGARVGGCAEGQWCCDDPFHPEILVGCSDSPCE